MLHTLKLLLPALIPSWRFFDVIAPSPRIEFRPAKTPEDTSADWQEFRPRPARLSMNAALQRMFWNPRWNESLFLVSCAERLINHPTEHSRQEIVKRLKNVLNTDASYLQFRLVFVSREGDRIQKEVWFTSAVHSLS
jgi:hypothetical protein